MPVSSAPPPVTLAAAQRRYRRIMAIEAALGMLVNGVLGTVMFWLLFGGAATVPVWGTAGLVADALPSTFIPVFLMTLTLTFVTRRRREGGAFDLIAAIGMPRLAGALPRHLLARSILLAACATVLTLAVVALLLAASGQEAMPFASAFLFKLGQNMAVGAIFSPIVVARALAEHR